MASQIADESKGPSGVPAYGVELSSSPKDAYKGFVDARSNGFYQGFTIFFVEFYLLMVQFSCIRNNIKFVLMLLLV